jgi:hypothetical protein
VQVRVLFWALNEKPDCFNSLAFFVSYRIYFLTDINIEARTPGDISLARGWMFKNVSVKCPEDGTIRVQNSDDMAADLVEK